MYFGRYNITSNFKVYDRYATGTVFNSLRISYCISCMLLVIRLSIPFNPLRAVMVIGCSAGIIIGSIFFGGLFSLAPLTFENIILLVIFAVGTFVVFNILYNIAQHYIEKFKRKVILN